MGNENCVGKDAGAMTLKPKNPGPMIAICENAVPEGEEVIVSVSVPPGFKTALFAGDVISREGGFC